VVSSRDHRVRGADALHIPIVMSVTPPAHAEVLAAAYARHPERFNRRPEPPKLPTAA
jgi:hypothetical protein